MNLKCCIFMFSLISVCKVRLKIVFNRMNPSDRNIELFRNGFCIKSTKNQFFNLTVDLTHLAHDYLLFVNLKLNHVGEPPDETCSTRIFSSNEPVINSSIDDVVVSIDVMTSIRISKKTHPTQESLRLRLDSPFTILMIEVGK